MFFNTCGVGLDDITFQMSGPSLGHLTAARVTRAEKEDDCAILVAITHEFNGLSEIYFFIQ